MAPHTPAGQRRSRSGATSLVGQILATPPRWLAMYDDFITKNAGQVSQIESTLRSLTYIIPGRFRDAEIASESIHSGVQLLSLYHDSLLAKAVSRLPGLPPAPTAHSRYTRFWCQKSKLYRRVAMVLQMVMYTELLCEMTAKRRGGERLRWKVVVSIEAIKAFCRLLLLRITRSRPLVTPVLPERDAIPQTPDQDQGDDDDDDDDDARQGEEKEEDAEEEYGEVDEEEKKTSAHGLARPAAHERAWKMPRTGMRLPSLPEPSDISSYLLGRVLSADDIKPANKLLNQLQGASQAAEMMHILAPLVYAVALFRSSSSSSKKSWTPWLVGVAVEYTARQLRDRTLRTTALERDEWNKRAWGMAWWTMRGAFYEQVTKGVVRGARRKMPGFVAGILEDYEYLWENYYFSTSA